jgi:outer membrane lipoprotein-sorting protein
MRIDTAPLKPKEMNVDLKACLVAVTLLAAPAAMAATPMSSTAEYSADSSMETEFGAMKSKIYHAPNKERREMSQGGENMIMILRQDKKIMWNVMPSQRMYMEMALQGGGDNRQGGADINNYNIEQTVVGEETVNGVKTTKSKVIMKPKSGNGTKMGGFMWITKDGIPVKTDVIAVDGNKKARMKLELTNLKVGKQDPGLFEPPAGYTKMDMGAMMGGAYGRHR